ncbi:IS1634 family transposase [Nitrococcus mobilis]|uniref:Transposase n=1 Tax=Nitrococcus mobilis Nb-231 TaxID=314278 RepID=A4BM76_9GAMM|nr:IS1634 family transposase [Nitrococcus mobilis]EAR23414.1 transposase [Nitrococcus mobilis Nb-231]
MFIRRTQTRSTATGESYVTYRLVRSERRAGKVRQRTLLNLGRHFPVAQAHWSALCARIEQRLSGQAALFDEEGKGLPLAVERQAERIAARLLAEQGGTPAPADAGGVPGGGGDVQSVDVDSLSLVRPRSVGVEQLALWALRQAGLEEQLQALGLTGPQRAAALGLIVARMAAPGSERATYQWLARRSGLGELLEVDFEAMSPMQLYRTSDILLRHRAALEGHLFARVSDLFALAPTITLYDLTNTYFEGEAPVNPAARHGHSKERRSDCPLLTLALVLDACGFVRRSRVFAGNAAEAQTLQGMLTGLAAPAGALVVMDRGVATEANLAWLAEQGYRYLVVSRERRRAVDFKEAITLDNAGGQAVELLKVPLADGQGVRLYCRSEGRVRKEQAIAGRLMDRFEAGLDKLATGLSRRGTTKRIDKLWERIGRLKEKSRGLGQHYHIEVIAGDSGERARAIHWQRLPVKGSLVTEPGVYCLRSNETGWDEKTMWRTYIMLTDLEAVFRSLKSELGLRPIFHHKEERAEGHLFITVLAYQFVQLIRHRLAAHGICERWSTLRDTLAGQCRVTATFNRGDGRTLHVRKATRAEPDQARIYQALGADPAPGGVQKTIV